MGCVRVCAATLVAATLCVACRREEPPPVDRCSPLVTQMDALVARGGQCEGDSDCAYFPRRPALDDAGTPSDRQAAGVTDKATATELERIGRLYIAAQCSPELATSPQTSRYKTVHIACEEKHCMGVTFF